MRTARSRISALYLTDFFMAPFSQEKKPPQNPGRFTSTYTINNDYENRAWQTIEVRTAKSRRVEITIEPDSARDLGERQLVTNSVDEEWTNLLLQKARAEQALQVGHEAYENCLFNCGPAK